MEEYVPTPYVNARAKHFLKLATEATELLEELKKEQPGVPARISRDEYVKLVAPMQVFKDLAWGLSEAMKTLDVYADKAFWTEVPEKTFAASDLGTRARVALNRIDPV